MRYYYVWPLDTSNNNFKHFKVVSKCALLLQEYCIVLQIHARAHFANVQFFYISFCWHLAEARESKDMTEKSDIYGFGLILIELLTGKSPADAEFGVQYQSMVEWARYCYSDCHLDMWVDPIIRGHASNNNQNQIVATMNLALRCTAGDPAARPCATDLSKTLQSAFSISLKFSSPVQAF